jgi:SepF-like predicted cell division protein (DUF552 family)
MKEAEMDQIAQKVAANVVAKLMEPEFQDGLAEAIAKQLRQLAGQYSSDLAKLGERLEDRHF